MTSITNFKRDCLRDFRDKSYIQTDADLVRFSEAIDRFLDTAAERGLSLEEINDLSRGGIHFAALLELMAQDVRNNKV